MNPTPTIKPLKKQSGKRELKGEKGGHGDPPLHFFNLTKAG